MQVIGKLFSRKKGSSMCMVSHNFRAGILGQRHCWSNNRIAGTNLRNGTSEVRSLGWDWSMGSLEVGQYQRLRMGWTLKARGSCLRSCRAINKYFVKPLYNLWPVDNCVVLGRRPQCVNTNYVVLCWLGGSALRRFGDVVQKVCHVLQQGPAVKAR